MRHQDLHDRLLLAAEAVITAAGLANLRARNLAEAVGCSVGAIYGVFPDLDAVVLEVNGRTLAAIDAAMRLVPADQAPVERLASLALAYLDFAQANRQRWRALFQHALPAGHTPAPWFAERQRAAFSHVEGPLGVLAPSLPEAARALLARSVFSAVHGIVALGLDEKVATMPMPVLRAQLRLVVEAIARGLALDGGGLTPPPAPQPRGGRQRRSRPSRSPAAAAPE